MVCNKCLLSVTLNAVVALNIVTLLVLLILSLWKLINNGIAEALEMVYLLFSVLEFDVFRTNLIY